MLANLLHLVVGISVIFGATVLGCLASRRRSMLDYAVQIQSHYVSALPSVSVLFVPRAGDDATEATVEFSGESLLQSIGILLAPFFKWRSAKIFSKSAFKIKSPRIALTELFHTDARYASVDVPRRVLKLRTLLGLAGGVTCGETAPGLNGLNVLYTLGGVKLAVRGTVSGDGKYSSRSSLRNGPRRWCREHVAARARARGKEILVD